MSASDPADARLRETLVSVRALMNAQASPTALRQEGDRIAELRSPSTDLATVAESTAKTAAAVMAEAAVSLLAQANYSQRNVSDLLTFVSDAPAPRGPTGA